tara:strand:- start:273 stop:491 length:219 start_codon:yes stop_codon:yes gene_type:complete
MKSVQSVPYRRIKWAVIMMTVNAAINVSRDFQTAEPVFDGLEFDTLILLIMKCQKCLKADNDKSTIDWNLDV